MGICSCSRPRLLLLYTLPQRLDIAHPMFWTSGDGSGTHPAPFTLITSEAIQQGTWTPVQDEHKV